MAEFKVVRYENSTDTPIVDGQVLVDMQTTAMSFDINGERKHSNYVFGVYVNVEAYEWYKEDRPLEGKYYLDIMDLYPDGQIPDGYSLASVVFNAGQESIVGTQCLYADEPLSGTALLLFTPTDKHQDIDTTLASPRAMVIFHLDDEYWSDPTGSFSITNSGCSFLSGASKFGSGSLFKSSVGELSFGYDTAFNSAPESFTVEWWEKAADSNYTGTIRIQINDDVYTVPAAPVGSARRNPNVWHHVAVSRIGHDTSVYMYVDGKMTAIFDVYIDGISNFGILGSTSHVVNISELAFFNYCKYKKEFTPSDVPYKGFGEVSIAVTGDIIGENMLDSGYFSATIPIAVRDMFGDPLLSSDITIVDPGEHGGYAHITQLDDRINIYPGGDDALFARDLEFNVYAKYQASLSKPIKVKIFTGAATYPDSDQSGGGSVDLGPIEERLSAVEELAAVNSNDINGIYGEFESYVSDSDFEFFTAVDLPRILGNYATSEDLTVVAGRFNSYTTTAAFNNFKNSDFAIIANKASTTEASVNLLTNRVTELENRPSGGGNTEEVTVSGTTPTIESLKGKTVYICTSVITSLTIGSMDNGHDDATIIFTTGSTFTASFPASMKWISNSAFGVNKTYIVAVCSGIAVASEVINE